jgi:hypothetical protein
MIQVVASNAPVDVAWAAFDRAAIRFHRMYSRLDPRFPDDDADRAERMKAAQEVATLWDEWRKLFLGDDADPRPAA